jgi:uncharacterized membrane protein
MKKIVFILSFFLIFFIKPQLTFAETIHAFDVQLNAHKNGLMDVTETINYDFQNLAKHGIYRDIPFVSKVGDLYRVIKIENIGVTRDGESENFVTSNSNNIVTVKIGNADRTVTGGHIYKISYTVENGIGSNYSDHDEIFWNATGNGWQIPIESASLKITNDFNVSPNNLICFTGVLNARDKNCSVSVPKVSTTRALNSGEGLTMVVSYNVGTFPKSVLLKTLPKTAEEVALEKAGKYFPLFSVIFYLLLPIGILIWYMKRKNKQRFGKPTVNFDIPKDENGNIIRPALSGTIDTAKLERDDVTATIFDLAIRKYIRLEEKTTKEKVLGVFDKNNKEQIITKLKNQDAKLNKYEKTLMSRLFEDGDIIKVKDLKTDFYQTFQDMENDVFQMLVDKKYYTKNPKVQKAFLIFLGVASLFLFNIFLAIVLFFLSRKLNGRTALGDEIDFKIDGLKLFLKAMDRNYKWQAEKFYVVEQMIPYAMALGYIDEFMEQLKIINPDYSPTWYTGYSGSFYASYALMYAVTSSNITTSAPSSSSGFSGGGFSGGGGGGGGGGSW